MKGILVTLIGFTNKFMHPGRNVSVLGNGLETDRSSLHALKEVMRKRTMAQIDRLYDFET